MHPQKDPPSTGIKKGKTGIARIIAAAGYSLKGIKAAIRNEAAFRQEVFLAVILCPIAFWKAENVEQLLWLIGSIVSVLVVELLNSAIEALADAISLDHHPLLGQAKDLGSAAVLLTLIFAMVVWLLHLYRWFA